jgi:hypothetical protein
LVRVEEPSVEIHWVITANKVAARLSLTGESLQLVGEEEPCMLFPCIFGSFSTTLFEVPTPTISFGVGARGVKAFSNLSTNMSSFTTSLREYKTKIIRPTLGLGIYQKERIE